MSDSNPVQPEPPRQSWLHVEVLTRQKALWVKAAQAEGLKLAAWVVKTLDAAARKP